MADKPDLFMPLFVGDYQADTTRLTLEQDGAYLRLLMDYWRNGPPPDDDDVLARILRVDRRVWVKLRPALSPFFVIVGGRWTHKRVERELERAARNKAAAVERARKGGQEKARRAASSTAPSTASSTPQALLGVCSPPPHSPTFGGEEEASRGEAEGKVVHFGRKPAA